MTSPQKPDDASSSASSEDVIKSLQAEMAALRLEKDAIEDTVRRLRAEEDFAAHVFRHKEIFTCSQEKLRLEAEIDIRQRKIRRLQEGY